jgi:hypothetical protein
MTVRSIVFIVALLAASVASGQNQADLAKQHRALESLSAARSAARVDGGLAKAAAPAGGAQVLQAQASGSGTYATVASANYGFEWMVFADGWYWTHDDTSYATSFYSVQQVHAGATYGVIFSLDIWVAQTTAYDLAAMLAGVHAGATFYANKQPDSIGIPAVPAYHNSYDYTSTTAGAAFSVDQWCFSYNGTVYCYEIFTDTADYTHNGALYLLMKNLSVVLPQTPVAKTTRPKLDRPYFRAVSRPTQGIVRFDGAPVNVPIYIYDLAGHLVQTVAAGRMMWDGTTRGGASVSQGYYVSTVKSTATAATARLMR